MFTQVWKLMWTLYILREEENFLLWKRQCEEKFKFNLALYTFPFKTQCEHFTAFRTDRGFFATPLEQCPICSAFPRHTKVAIASISRLLPISTWPDSSGTCMHTHRGSCTAEAEGCSPCPTLHPPLLASLLLLTYGVGLPFMEHPRGTFAACGCWSKQFIASCFLNLLQFHQTDDGLDGLSFLQNLIHYPEHCPSLPCLLLCLHCPPPGGDSQTLRGKKPPISLCVCFIKEHWFCKVKFQTDISMY